MTPNTPQGTGPMTLEQGIAHVKAKLAERGATVDDQVVNHPEEPDESGSRDAGDEYGGAVDAPDAGVEDDAVIVQMKG